MVRKVLRCEDEGDEQTTHQLGRSHDWNTLWRRDRIWKEARQLVGHLIGSTHDDLVSEATHLVTGLAYFRSILASALAELG